MVVVGYRAIVLILRYSSICENMMILIASWMVWYSATQRVRRPGDELYEGDSDDWSQSSGE